MKKNVLFFALYYCRRSKNISGNSWRIKLRVLVDGGGERVFSSFFKKRRDGGEMWKR
jgi:hypothetical protein